MVHISPVVGAGVVILTGYFLTHQLPVTPFGAAVIHLTTAAVAAGLLASAFCR